MTDESPPPLAEPLPENPQITPDVITPQPKKLNKKLRIIFGVVIGVICLASIICFTANEFGSYKVAQEKAPVRSVLDTFMNYMVANDVENAYALFSPRVRRQFSISKIQELTEGNNYVLFDGYQYLSIQNLTIGATVNINPDVPQGTVATATGMIMYKGGIQGTFNATLEKVDNKWQLDNINIMVPPGKDHP